MASSLGRCGSGEIEIDDLCEGLKIESRSDTGFAKCFFFFFGRGNFTVLESFRGGGKQLENERKRTLNKERDFVLKR